MRYTYEALVGTDERGWWFTVTTTTSDHDEVLSTHTSQPVYPGTATKEATRAEAKNQMITLAMLTDYGPHAIVIESLPSTRD